MTDVSSSSLRVALAYASISEEQYTRLFDVTLTRPTEPLWLQAGRVLDDHFGGLLDDTSFNAFCSIRLELHPRRARLLVESARVVSTLQERAAANGKGYMPTREWEAILLVGLPEHGLERVARELDGQPHPALEEFVDLVKATTSLDEAPYLAEPSTIPIASFASPPLDTLTRHGIPSFKKLKTLTDEKDLSPTFRKQWVAYATRVLRQEGVRARPIENCVIAVKSVSNRLAFFWPVLRSWQWWNGPCRKGSTRVENLVDVMITS